MKIVMDATGSIVQAAAAAAAAYGFGVLFGLGLLTACRLFGINVVIGCAKVAPPPDDAGPEPPDGLKGYYNR